MEAPLGATLSDTGANAEAAAAAAATYGMAM
jgi:hypothetical protein